MVIPRAKTVNVKFSNSTLLYHRFGVKLTVITHDQAVGGKELLVKDLLDISLVAILVRIHENEVEGSSQSLNGLLGWALNDLDTVVQVVPVKGPSRGGNHLRIQFQGDDFSLSLLCALIPGQGAVPRVATDLEDCEHLLD